MDKAEKALLERLGDKYDKFRAHTIGRGAEYSFDIAAQISIKTDFKGLIETTKFNASELMKLNECENLLDELYMKWLTYDNTTEVRMLQCLGEFLLERGAFKLHNNF